MLWPAPPEFIKKIVLPGWVTKQPTRVAAWCATLVLRDLCVASVTGRVTIMQQDAMLGPLCSCLFVWRAAGSCMLESCPVCEATV